MLQIKKYFTNKKKWCCKPKKSSKIKKIFFTKNNINKME